MTFSEEVDFTLSAITAAQALVDLQGKIKAVEYAGSDRTVQVGTAGDWRINPLTTAVAATIYSDTLLDLENGPALTVGGLSAGTMTVDPFDKTVLLPLLF